MEFQDQGLSGKEFFAAMFKDPDLASLFGMFPLEEDEEFLEDPPEGWEAAEEAVAAPAAGADAPVEEPEPKPASRKPTRKAPSPEPEEPRVVESVEDLGV